MQNIPSLSPHNAETSAPITTRRLTYSKSPLKKRPYLSHNTEMNDSKVRNHRMSPIKKRPYRLHSEDLNQTKQTCYFNNNFRQENENENSINSTTHFATITKAEKCTEPTVQSFTSYLTSSPCKIRRLSNESDTDTAKSSDDDLLSNIDNDDKDSEGNRCNTPASINNLSRTTTDQTSANEDKKVRINYSPDQVTELKRVFNENPYPNSDMMAKLSKDFNIPEGKIKIWFQNKRARWRRRNQIRKPMPTILPPCGSQYELLPGSPTYRFIGNHIRPELMLNIAQQSPQFSHPQSAQMMKYLNVPSYLYRYAYYMLPTSYYCQ